MVQFLEEFLKFAKRIPEGIILSVVHGYYGRNLAGIYKGIPEEIHRGISAEFPGEFLGGIPGEHLRNHGGIPEDIFGRNPGGIFEKKIREKFLRNFWNCSLRNS